MKRRKTVSVTPAMGASTVAGEMVIPPMQTEVGKTRVARALLPASAAAATELSQNLRTRVFYLFFVALPHATILASWSPFMRAIREILLTEYIGAIVVAVLVADAFTALITTVVAQITYHLAV
jgi:hypothetical protein